LSERIQVADGRDGGRSAADHARRVDRCLETRDGEFPWRSDCELPTIARKRVSESAQAQCGWWTAGVWGVRVLDPISSAM